MLNIGQSIGSPDTLHYSMELVQVAVPFKEDVLRENLHDGMVTKPAKTQPRDQISMEQSYRVQFSNSYGDLK